MDAGAAAEHAAEMAGDIAQIDQAMRWGFNWEMGPFETWDMLGFDETTNRMTDDRKNLISLLKTHLGPNNSIAKAKVQEINLSTSMSQFKKV